MTDAAHLRGVGASLAVDSGRMGCMPNGSTPPCMRGCCLLLDKRPPVHHPRRNSVEVSPEGTNSHRGDKRLRRPGAATPGTSSSEVAVTAPLTAEGYNTEVRKAAALLVKAQRDKDAKDTPANRAALEVAKKRLDTLFDQRETVEPEPMDMRAVRP